MKLLHIYQIGHVLDVHSPAYVFWICLTHLEAKFNFLKNVLYYIQNSFFNYDAWKNGFLMIILSNKTLIGSLLLEQKSLKQRLTHKVMAARLRLIAEAQIILWHFPEGLSFHFSYFMLIDLVKKIIFPGFIEFLLCFYYFFVVCYYFLFNQRLLKHFLDNICFKQYIFFDTIIKILQTFPFVLQNCLAFCLL